MNSSSRPYTLVLVNAPEAEGTVMHCAAAVAGARNLPLHVVGPSLPGGAAPTPDQPPSPQELPVDAAYRWAQVSRVAMLVSDWGRNPEERQKALRLAVRQNVPGVFVRPSASPCHDRVLIPTGGGHHTLQQLWVAQELARAYGAPTHVLRIVQDRAEAELAAGGQLRAGAALARLQARLAGIPAPIENCLADDVVSGVVACARPADLIVLGAPNYWRVAEHFEGSIPDLITKRLPNSVVMLLAKRPARLKLRDVFWGPLVSLNLAARTKTEAITMLVDTLTKHNQVPVAWRDYVLVRALAREQTVSTAVDCETAFPHVTMPDFTGIIGCIGICPSGLDFGAADGLPTKFLFLLLTPAEFYDEYLSLLSHIAQLMIVPELRQRLFRCRSAAEVLDVLEPPEK